MSAGGGRLATSVPISFVAHELRKARCDLGAGNR
jgi:hypothetical protein